MTASKFTDARKAFIIRGDGLLKRMVADLSLDREMLQDLIKRKL